MSIPMPINPETGSPCRGLPDGASPRVPTTECERPSDSVSMTEDDRKAESSLQFDPMTGVPISMSEHELTEYYQWVLRAAFILCVVAAIVVAAIGVTSFFVQ
ncbi:MAG: hypothetical protein HYU77_02105 [Betaproteobacteria bacterium]|nr:hypothetical protein [Betaproteobacteria bacterium]